MTLKILLVGVLTLFSLIGPSCSSSSDSKAQALIASKNGDSCLLEHKCKIVLRRWEGGGNVFYQCLVANSFYEVSQINEAVIVDLTGKNCEKVNP